MAQHCADFLYIQAESEISNFKLYHYRLLLQFDCTSI